MLRWGEIKQVCDELEPVIVHGQIQKVRQPDPTTLVLFIRSPGQTTRLVLSVTTGVVRIAVRDSSVPTLPTPTALGAWVRAAGGGRRVKSLRLSPNDRIVSLGLDQGCLVAELTGPSANLYGIDPENRLVTAAKPIVQSRGLVMSEAYEPPGSGLAHLDAISRFENARSIERVAQQRLADAHLSQDEGERRRLIKRARKKLGRLQDNIDQDANRCERADEWQRKGELLKGQLYRFERGKEAFMSRIGTQMGCQ